MERILDAGFAIGRDAVLQLTNAFRHDVVAVDGPAKLGKPNHRRHADVTGTDGADRTIHGLVRSFEAKYRYDGLREQGAVEFR